MKQYKYRANFNTTLDIDVIRTIREQQVIGTISSASYWIEDLIRKELTSQGILVDSRPIAEQVNTPPQPKPVVQEKIPGTDELA